LYFRAGIAPAGTHLDVMKGDKLIEVQFIFVCGRVMVDDFLLFTY